MPPKYTKIKYILFWSISFSQQIVFGRYSYNFANFQYIGPSMLDISVMPLTNATRATFSDVFIFLNNIADREFCFFDYLL